MSKIFLENLPKRADGKINWKESINFEIVYIDNNGEKGTFKVVENIDGQRIRLKHNGELMKKMVYKGDITKGRVERILSKPKNMQHVFNVGDIVSNVKSGELKILKKVKRKGNGRKYKYRGYLYKCLVCDHKDYIREGNLINNKSGCSSCHGKSVNIGFNDMWTTNPELARQLWNKEDGYKYTRSSSNRVDWKCQNCNFKIEGRIINSVSNNGLSCPQCSDGVSYPEKLMYNVLSNLGIDFIYQKEFEWIENKRYDFYLPELDIIIETYGEQHYTHTGFNRTLEEEQKNDKVKKMLAKENKIKNYIIIDCRKSELEYIKKNILQSKLSLHLDMNKVDWNKCDEKALDSLVRVACNFWAHGLKSSTKIAEKLGVSSNTIIKYLKRGSRLGWCDYDTRGIKRSVVQLSMNGEFIKEWSSANKAGVQLGMKSPSSSITAVCKGLSKSAGGYMWMYIEDYIERKSSIKIKPYINNKIKPVVQLSLDGSYIKEWASIASATRGVGLKSSSSIREVCTGKTGAMSAKGFKWVFKEDYVNDNNTKGIKVDDKNSIQ